jgi:SAM-dependent methyltransferase
MNMAQIDPALAAYEALGPDYDAFTAHHDYELWTLGLEALATRHGLTGRRLLDVACGTGKSFLPFLERGWEVTACDISPAMLAEARRKAGGRASLHVIDARSLPALGSFDFVCCLDDVANYLTDPAELEQAFRRIRANLAPAGLLLFDANTLATYRGFFGETVAVERDGRLMVWQGSAGDLGEGGLAEATLDVVRPNGAAWDRRTSRHLQRHHPERRVRRLLRAAGLECVAVYGQFPDVRFEQPLDELRHSKAIYIARRTSPSENGRR